MAQLLDNSAAFAPVYTIYQHNKLGFLIGAYVVEIGQDNHFTLNYQRLLPENYEQFLHRLDERDIYLLKLLDEIVLKRLYNQFRRKESSLQQFLNKFDKNPHKDYILQYVERRVTQALPLLADRWVFSMSRDGYPAHKPLSVRAEPLHASFHIERNEAGLTYWARVFEGSQELQLQDRTAELLAFTPPWLRIDQQIAQVADLPDGRRLRPFLTKPSIHIPKKNEKEYFQKFLKNLIAECEVETKGFEVNDVEEAPQLTLYLQQDTAEALILKPRVRYNGFDFLPDPSKQFKVKLVEEAGEQVFYRISRQPSREQAFLALFDDLREGQISLTDLNLPFRTAYDWLVEQQAALAALGVQLERSGLQQPYRFEAPFLEVESSRQANYYLLAGRLRVAEQVVPFHSIRNNILQQDPTLTLPDGTMLLLPQRWLTEFRHLFEVAAPLANGLRLESYHASLISATLNGQADRQALSLPDFQDLGEYELPGQLEADLRDYQRAGYNWLCFLHDYALGGILADDMGLGKTLQTLALLQRTYEQGAEAPSLIVVPNSIIYNWQLEAQRFCPALKVLIYTGAKRHNLLKQFYDYHVILTTYGIIRQDEAHLSPITFEHVVLDESHLIKNREAKTTQAVFQLQGRQKLTLTGTPIENTTMDLWTQMHFLNPRLLGSAAFFERHYAHPIEKERNEDRAAKLRSLTRPFIMRRTKEMVAQDLPPKSEQVHYCNMTPDQEAVYERTKQLYRATLFKDENDTAEIFARNRMQVLSSIQRLRQIAIHPRLIQPEVTTSGKYEQMKEMLTEVLAENSKVLIFSQFVKLLKIIAEDLRRDGIGYSYLDGSTKTSARAEAVRKFQEEDAHRAFLISLKAGGVGLNLTAAEYVFMMDPWWNPAVEQQAINRAHRIGQDKSVFVYKFITRNTIEEKIQQLQHRKLQIAGEVIKSEEKFFKSLTKADLESLFE